LDQPAKEVYISSNKKFSGCYYIGKGKKVKGEQSGVLVAECSSIKRGTARGELDVCTEHGGLTSKSLTDLRPKNYRCGGERESDSRGCDGGEEGGGAVASGRAMF